MVEPVARWQTDAETRAQQKLAAEQLARLERREEELRQREDVLIHEKRSLTELRQRLENEQSTIKHEHDALKLKLAGIDHGNEQIKKEKERLSQLYFELHALDGKNTGRLQQLQKSIGNLRQQEEQMNAVSTELSIGESLTVFASFSSNTRVCPPNGTISLSSVRACRRSEWLPPSIRAFPVSETRVFTRCW